MSLKSFISESSWLEILADEFQAPYFLELEKSLEKASKVSTVYPPHNQIFNALNETPFNNVKVVILGQDPYHGKGQAHGLSFSVNPGVKLPPSLVNIFKEYNSDLGFPIPKEGSLINWAREGVMLLNNQLSVVEGSPMSHKDIGWDQFTNVIIEKLNQKKENLVFILWGAPAQKKAKSVDHNKHFVIQSVHPSPLSSYRGFFGSKPFSQTNDYLKSKNIKPINWKLT